MSLAIYTITIDCGEPMLVAAFWAAALDFSIAYVNDDEVAIEPSDDAAPALLFLRTSDGKSAKNRIHWT